MPLRVVSVDDPAPLGAFLDAFYRFGIDSSRSPSDGRNRLRSVHSLLTADKTTLQTLLNRHGGLVYCSMDLPLPLALRHSLIASLKEVHQWARESGESNIVVFDNQAIELANQHSEVGCNTEIVSSRHHTKTRTDHVPKITPDDRKPSPLQSIYDQLLIQFFCDADEIEIRSMDESVPNNGSIRAVQTTNDVNKLIIRRKLTLPSDGDNQRTGAGAQRNQYSFEQTVFAKFGAPYRLEREFVNFNRLTAAVACELRDHPDGRVHMRRLFGYGHLSDRYRPIAESSTDFLGLFVASWHSHTKPTRGRQARDGRLDNLLSHVCHDYEDPRLVNLVEQLCRTLSVLQGEWFVQRQSGSERYDCFFNQRRVLKLNFDQVSPHVPGATHPVRHVVYKVCSVELLASRRQQPVDRLDCRIRPVSDSSLIGATSDSSNLSRPERDDIRLILKADAIDAVSDVVAILSNAYERRIREGAEISFPFDLLKRGDNGFLDQLGSRVNAQVGDFTRASEDFRRMIIDTYGKLYSGIDSLKPQDSLMGRRIHGDLYLVNVMWSCELGSEYDFSIIDFEKMAFDAPAAWDYVILELSLRFHWFLDRYKSELGRNGNWHGKGVLDAINREIKYLEGHLATLTTPDFRPASTGGDGRPESHVDGSLTASNTRAESTDHLNIELVSGYSLLRRLVKTIRGAFLIRSRQVEGELDDEGAKADYNRAMLMAAASRTIGRHPDDYPSVDGALRIIWLSHIGQMALKTEYRLSPDARHSTPA